MIVYQTNIVTTKESCLLHQSENTFTSLVSYKYCVKSNQFQKLQHNLITHFFNKISVLQSADRCSQKFSFEH
jgi:CRISPR-associated protein Cas8b1/Cst1 subtype I-B